MKSARGSGGISGGRMEEVRRTSRVLDLIQDISNAPHRWQRKDLAHKYQVSERQIQKDLAIIRHSPPFSHELY